MIYIVQIEYYVRYIYSTDRALYMMYLVLILEYYI